MKTIFLVTCAIIATTALSVIGQNSFTNLNFESSTLPVSPQGQVSIVPVGQAFPGWQALVGGVEQSAVYYNGIPFGASSVTLLNFNSDLGASAIEGQFSLVLHHGGGPDLSVVSLTQTGIVPANALSLQAAVQNPIEPFFSFSLNGIQIAMNPIAVTPNYTLYGGDISPFAGQNATLAVSALPTQSFGYAVYFDSIVFSPVPVPEPSLVGLLALAGLSLSLRQWRKSRRE